MFQLQRAILRRKTEQSPGTFNDSALYGIPYNAQSKSLNVPGLCSVFSLMMAGCSRNMLPSF